MTEKRFTTKNIICSNYCVWDNNDKPYGNDEVVELLNELHEENITFREALKELKEIGDYQAKRINELNDENEQLKSLNIPIEEIKETVVDYKGRIVGVYYND